MSGKDRVESGLSTTCLEWSLSGQESCRVTELGKVVGTKPGESTLSLKKLPHHVEEGR